MERHKCQEYCRAKKHKHKRDVNNNSNNNSRGPARRRLNNNEPIFCRFGYPFKAPENLNDIFLTHVKIVQKRIVKKNQDGIEITTYKHKCELVITRNDSWLNSPSRAIMEVWRANMGIQLIIDARKVAEYMTKYVTKPESVMSLSFRNMNRYII